MFAVIDIETTGTAAANERITEIAIILHNGKEVEKTFSTLINPERGISPYITLLTGITNEMAARAPKFYEVARQIVEWTEGRVFVAHNVKFDYSFVVAEFARLGYKYERKQLCTVQTARRVFPGHASYSLGKLCDALNIPHANRHRALGDAEATAILFAKIVEADANGVIENALYPGRRKLTLPPNLPYERFENLPQAPGVYYFVGENNEVIYTGKSVNIRDRVMSHFRADAKSDKAAEMKFHTRDLKYQLTGTELIALLLESEEIKRLQPRFNVQQKKVHFPYGLFYYYDNQGYARYFIDKKGTKNDYLLEFTSKKQGVQYLEEKVRQHSLCARLCHLDHRPGPCFQAQIHKCKGACTGQEPPQEYNQRAQNAMGLLIDDSRLRLIIDQGRTPNETSFVLLEGGLRYGYGYLPAEQIPQDLNQLVAQIPLVRATQDARFILIRHILHAPPQNIFFPSAVLS